MRRPWLVCCGGLAVALMIVGCGDSSDEGGSDDEGTSGGTETDDAGDTGSAHDPTADDGTGSGSQSSGSATGDDGGTMSGGSTGDTGGTGTTGGAAGCEGLGSSGLLLHTTLDDSASVNSPAVGNGMGQVMTMPADDFVPAQSGNGVNIDEAGEMVEFPQMTNGGANVDLTQGTIDFCFKPNYDSAGFDQSDEFGFFSTSDSGQGWIRMRVSGSNGRGGLQVIVLPPGGGGVNEIMVPPSNYSFVSGQWHRVTVRWDFNVGQGEQNIHVYVDGAEVVSPMPPTGPVAMGSPSPNGDVVIGSIPMNGWHANGVIDEFKLYDSALMP